MKRLLALFVLTAVCALAQNSISLSTPQLRTCGTVEIGGGFTAPGLQHVPPTWDWGDGVRTKSFFPAFHRYGKNGTYTVTASVLQDATVLASASVQLTITTAEKAGCGNLHTVLPASVLLRDGRTSQQLKAVHVDPDSNYIPLDGSQLRFRSRNPKVAEVTDQGLITGTGFGDTIVEVEDLSTGTIALVQVQAGDLRIEPPYLRLTLGAQPEQQLTIRATNADGSPVDLAGRTVSFFRSPAPGDDPVISLRQDGVVRALRLPRTFAENPAIHARVDGVMSGNICFVRVAEALPDLSFVNLKHGRTRFHIAEKVGQFDYRAILESSEVPRVTDLSLMWQEAASGLAVSRGGERTLVNDVGGTMNPADPSVPCGISGNPTLLGSTPGKENHNSCLIAAYPPPAPPYPSWFIYFHEIGHDYTLTSQRFNEIASAAPMGPLRFSFIEAFATTLGTYSAEAIRRNRGHYGIPDSVLDEFSKNQLELDSPRWTHALRRYEEGGSDFSKLDPDILTAIILQLMREEGLGWYSRLHSIFLPQHSPLAQLRIEGEVQASTALIAGISAAIGRDLSGRFKDQWRFPFDAEAYDRYLPVLRQLAWQRQSLLNPEAMTHAASRQTAPAAPLSRAIVAGENLALRSFTPENPASEVELASAAITDQDGKTHAAHLLSVSPSQIEILIPDHVVSGPALLQLDTWLGRLQTEIEVTSVSPGLFSADGSGQGLAAASWRRVHPDGAETLGLVTGEPLDLSPAAGELYLTFLGSGFRKQTTATIWIDGIEVPVVAVRPHESLAGMDELAVGPVPIALSGRGQVQVEAHFDGRAANLVSLAFR